MPTWIGACAATGAFALARDGHPGSRPEAANDARQPVCSHRMLRSDLPTRGRTVDDSSTHRSGSPEQDRKPAPAAARRIEVDGQVAWCKQYVTENRRWRLAALNAFADRLGLDPLRAPPARSAIETCATELTMIRRLDALGMRVPRVLEAGPTHLLLSDLGLTLAECCRRTPDPAQRQQLIDTGFAALLELHRRGGYLSQAFARNLTLDDGTIGFIDLEQDPREVMSLSAAQARDVLFYVHSTARFLLDAPTRFRASLDAHLAQESDAVVQHIRNAARRLAWLAPFARLIGGRSRAVAEALRQLAHSRH